MRTDKPAIVNLSEMQHDHSSAEQGGLIARAVYLTGYMGVLDDGAVFCVWTIPDDISGTIPEDLVGSAGTCESGFEATATATFSLEKNGVAFGSAAFAGAASDCTFSSASATGVSPGDRIKAINPSPADATLAGVALTIKVVL